MPNNVYFWSTKERAQHNTERHQVFVKELYSNASLSRKEFKEKLEEFKSKNFDLLDSENVVAVDCLRQEAERNRDVTSFPTDSKLNNKLEG